MKALIVTTTTMSVLIINVCCFRYEDSKNVKIIKHDLSFINIPTQFDARDEWRNCTTIGRLDHREHNGQEWAIISASVMSDRLCIKSKGRFTKSLSAEELIECAVTSRGEKQEPIGCEGWHVRWEPFKFWEDEGVVTKRCKSQLEENVCDSNRCILCHYTCQDKTLDYRRQKTFSVKTLQSNTDNPDPRQIQAEIMINGPVMTLMPGGQITIDGAFHYDEKKESSGSCYYKIIGWDMSLSRLTWLAVGSHGVYDFPHMEFGVGGFERHVYAGVPDICKTQHAKNKLMMANKSLMINVFAAHLLLSISLVMMLMV